MRTYVSVVTVHVRTYRTYIITYVHTYVHTYVQIRMYVIHTFGPIKIEYGCTKSFPVSEYEIHTYV